MKAAKKAICMILTLILALSCFAIVSSAASSTPLPSEVGSVLTSGTYTVSSSMTISALIRSGQSALEIAPGATVTIELKNYARLTLQGGSASFAMGAGAGIRVPEGSTLYITGYGSLTAIGGDAAKGFNGLDGNDGETYGPDGIDWGYSGYGGSGGEGGGGAGAGIGGKGGNGGQGGEYAGGVNSIDGTPDDIVSGLNGGKGGNGENGETMGTVIVIGRGVTLDVRGGKAAANGVCGKNGANSRYVGTTFSDNSFGGGGGAGSGGFGGGAASDIGGGGFGGGGGGAGGSGAAVSNIYSSLTTDNKTGMGAGYSETGVYPDLPTPILYGDATWYGGLAGYCGKSGVKGGDGFYAVHNHSFATAWTYNETAHWHVCEAANCIIGSDYADCNDPDAAYGAHINMEDGVCDTCGYIDAAVKSLYDAQTAAINEVKKAAGSDPSDTVAAMLASATASIRAIKNIDDIETVKFFAISTITSLQIAENSAAALASVQEELEETNQKLDNIETELSGTKDEIAKLTELLNKALEALAENEAPETPTTPDTPAAPETPTTPDTPDTPDEPASDVCAKCGRSHANNFFGKILCFFYRFFDLFR